MQNKTLLCFRTGQQPILLHLRRGWLALALVLALALALVLVWQCCNGSVAMSASLIIVSAMASARKAGSLVEVDHGASERTEEMNIGSVETHVSLSPGRVTAPALLTTSSVVIPAFLRTTC